MSGFHLEGIDLLEVSTTGETSCGQVWVVIDGVSFPGVGWTDLPISVLSSISTAFCDLAGGSLEAWSYFF